MKYFEDIKAKILDKYARIIQRNWRSHSFRMKIERKVGLRQRRLNMNYLVTFKQVRKETEATPRRNEDESPRRQFFEESPKKSHEFSVETHTSYDSNSPNKTSEYGLDRPSRHVKIHSCLQNHNPYDIIEQFNPIQRSKAHKKTKKGKKSRSPKKNPTKI